MDFGAQKLWSPSNNTAFSRTAAIEACPLLGSLTLFCPCIHQSLLTLTNPDTALKWKLLSYISSSHGKSCQATSLTQFTFCIADIAHHLVRFAYRCYDLNRSLFFFIQEIPKLSKDSKVVAAWLHRQLMSFSLGRTVFLVCYCLSCQCQQHLMLLMQKFGQIDQIIASANK